MLTNMLFRRKSKRSIPPNLPLPILTRCICDRVFKPESDMETYCSSACARSDSLRALSGGDTLYRRKALQAQSSDNPPDAPQQRPPPRALPQRPPSPVTPPFNQYQGYPPLDIRPLPPLPNGPRKDASPAPHCEVARSALASVQRVAPSEPAMPVTKGTTPIPGGTSNFASPYGVSSGRTYTKVTKKPTTSRPALPIGPAPAKGYSRSTKETPQKQRPPNTSTDRAHPKGSRQAREPTPRMEKREVRKSASMSFVREAGSLWGKVPADWRQVEPMPLPPGVPQTKPLQVRSRAKAASPSGQGPNQQDTGYGYSTERRLRHSKSFSPYKPSYVANVPEDVHVDGPAENPDDVWWVVRCLRGVEEEDYKMRLLSRQTRRW